MLFMYRKLPRAIRCRKGGKKGWDISQRLVTNYQTVEYVLVCTLPLGNSHGIRTGADLHVAVLRRFGLRLIFGLRSWLGN